MGPLKVSLDPTPEPASASSSKASSPREVDQRVSKQAAGLSHEEESMKSALEAEVKLGHALLETESKLTRSIGGFTRKIETTVQDLESRGLEISEKDQEHLQHITHALTELKDRIANNPLDMSNAGSKRLYASVTNNLKESFTKLEQAIKDHTLDGSSLAMAHDNVEKTFAEYRNASLALETDHLRNASLYSGKNKAATASKAEVLKNHLAEEVESSRSHLIQSVDTLERKIQAREEAIERAGTFAAPEDRDALKELKGVLESFKKTIEERPLDVSKEKLKGYYRNTGAQINELFEQISYGITNSADPKLNLATSAQALQKTLSEYQERAENLSKFS